MHPIVHSTIVLAFAAVRLGDAPGIEPVLSATFRITNGNASATCFLVAPPANDRTSSVMLVTAAHVLESFGESPCRVILRRELPSGDYSRQEVVVPLQDGSKRLWRKHADVDVAVVPFALPAGAAVAPLRFDQLATEQTLAERKVRVGQDAWVPCYPAKLEANGAGWPLVRKGSIATHPLTPLKSARTILVDFNSFGGESGAPVLVRTGDQTLVVGLVSGMLRQTDKSVLPFEERTMHTPLGISIVAQAPLIREAIESLDR